MFNWIIQFYCARETQVPIFQCVLEHVGESLNPMNKRTGHGKSSVKKSISSFNKECFSKKAFGLKSTRTTDAKRSFPVNGPHVNSTQKLKSNKPLYSILVLTR